MKYGHKSSPGRRLAAAVAVLAAQLLCAGAVQAGGSCSEVGEARSYRIEALAAPHAVRAVLIVHGASGLARFREAYVAYAKLMVSRGVSAYLIDYYSPHEISVLAEKGAAGLNYPAHVRCWVERISAAVDELGSPAAKPRSLSLLGFSQGARLAVAVAATHSARVDRIVTLYGRLPRDDERTAPLQRLPELLNLHGDEDREVPVQEGRRLVNEALRLGGRAEIVVYPGEGHGFDFSNDSAAAADARRRVVEFLSGPPGRATSDPR